jgi:hypothetical protein
MLTTVVVVLTIETIEDDYVYDAVEAVLDAGTLQDAVAEWGKDHDQALTVTGAYAYSEDVLASADAHDQDEHGN